MHTCIYIKLLIYRSATLLVVRYLKFNYSNHTKRYFRATLYYIESRTSINACVYYDIRCERKHANVREKNSDKVEHECVCVRACVYDNAHCNFLRIVTSIRYYTVSLFCFFVCLLLCFQLHIFLYAPLSPHFIRWNGPSVFFCPSSFPSTQHPTSYHRPSSNRTNVKSGVSALSSTSTAFGTAASNARLDQTGNGHIDEALRQQALAEEEAAMNQYKVLAREATIIRALAIEALIVPISSQERRVIFGMKTRGDPLACVTSSTSAFRLDVSRTLRWRKNELGILTFNWKLPNEWLIYNFLLKISRAIFNRIKLKKINAWPFLKLVISTVLMVFCLVWWRHCVTSAFNLQAKVQSPSSGPSTNPFLSSPTNNANQPIVDLFGAAPASDNQQVRVARPAT